MARPTKLSDKTQSQLVKLIQTGVPITDACSFVGIANSTYYDWIRRGADGDPQFSEFSEAVSRAREAAKVTAIGTLRSAMTSTKSTSTTTEAFTETRINQFGQEYEYKRVTERRTVTVIPGDWRAAIEYLKRRYRDEWSEKSIIEHQDWRAEAVEQIRDGKLSYEVLRDEFGEDLADQLFKSAGVPIGDAGEAGAGEA